MKIITINQIKYKNFNGFPEFVLELNGKSAQVHGRNDAGKTTLENGYLWLLSGKDQNGKTFSPKPKDKENQEIIGLEPSVEMELSIDGQVVNLSRTLEEKWTKKRGELESTRGNDTTVYTVDGVPKLEKDFKAYLETIAAESILPLLTNPKAFMQLAWKERRAILVELTGLTDEEIMEKSDELKELAELLDGRTVDDFREVLKSEKKKVLKGIEDLPGRIQENTDAIERLNLGDMTKEKVAEGIEQHDKKIEATQTKLSTAQTGDASLDYQEQLSRLRLKETEARTGFLTNENTEVAGLQQQVNAQQQVVNGLRNDLNVAESDLYRANSSLTKKQNLREELLEKYHSLVAEMETKKSETFDNQHTTCPTCSQELPQEQITGLVEKFNISKSEKLLRLERLLQENKETGTANKEDTEKLTAEITKLTKKVYEIKAKLETDMHNLDAINNKLTVEKGKEVTFEDSDIFKNIQQEIAAVQMKINNATKDSSQAIREAKEDLEKLTHTRDSLKFALGQFDHADEFNKRIAELRGEDKRLKELNADIERKIYLIEEFTRTKVKMLEESINEKFSYVKFKLFNLQKNGALNEVCEATVDGIEYSSGLNTSARVKADIDIHNVLSNHYGLSAPIFIDNAEGINKGKLPETTGQRIELLVGEEPELKVEVSE